MNTGMNRRSISSVVASVVILFSLGCTPQVDAPPADPNAPVVRYHVVGGIGYRDEEQSVWPDGRVTVVSGVGPTKGTIERTLPDGANSVNSLIAEIKGTGVGGVAPGDYGEKNHCCDRQDYDIEFTLDGKRYAYHLVDGTKAPDQVWKAQTTIRDALQKATVS
jgi:hypothetical protein